MDWGPLRASRGFLLMIGHWWGTWCRYVRQKYDQVLRKSTILSKLGFESLLSLNLCGTRKTRVFHVWNPLLPSPIIYFLYLHTMATSYYQPWMTIGIACLSSTSTCSFLFFLLCCRAMDGYYHQATFSKFLPATSILKKFPYFKLWHFFSCCCQHMCDFSDNLYVKTIVYDTEHWLQCMTLHTTERLKLSWPLLHSWTLWYTQMQYDMSNLKFQNIQRQSAWAPGNTSSSLPKCDFLDALSKSLPRCDILWHFWKRWGQNQCQTPTTSPWPNYPSKKTIGMSDVLFYSLYDSELPNAKGCAQWKIELQLFGKGGSVIVYWGKDGKELKCMEIHESMWVVLLLPYELRYSNDDSAAIDVYELHHT